MDLQRDGLVESRPARRSSCPRLATRPRGRPPGALGLDRRLGMPAQPVIEYTVRRSDRARRVRVAVDPERGVEVVLPQRAPKRAAAEAIRELRPWIERRLDEAERARAAVAARGNTVPYLDETLTLVPRDRPHPRASEGTSLVGARQRRRPTALERWFRRAARREIEPRLDHAVEVLGARYERLTIRNQKTRWGSCSLDRRDELQLAPAPGAPRTSSTTSSGTRPATCSCSTTRRASGRCSPRHVPDYAEPRRWLRRHGQTLVL